MKNLTDFKRRLADTLNSGGTVDFTRHELTAYSDHHPLSKMFPGGEQVKNAVELGCKIGRVQAASFARVNSDGKESWLEFGKAGHWVFPDTNTAVFSDGYQSTDHNFHLTLTYKFNQP